MMKGRNEVGMETTKQSAIPAETAESQPREARLPHILRWLGIVLILETGLIHYLAALTEFQEAEYMGYLFVANFLVGLLAAYGIFRRQRLGWLLGLGLAGASIGGYIYSRTAGMPGMAVEEWFSPYGLVALAVEGLFLSVLAFGLWRGALNGVATAPSSRPKVGRVWSAAGLLVLVLISYPAYRWDAYVASQVGQHEHVGSLDQVCSTPITSAADLRQKYGLEVVLVASTAMNSFVDVRLKVIDAEKASGLLVNQVAILVGQQELLLAPHIHTHAKPRNGKIITIFFPNRTQSILPGSQISLVFGKTRTESFNMR
jgi:hypothetical protein